MRSARHDDVQDHVQDELDGDLPAHRHDGSHGARHGAMPDRRDGGDGAGEPLDDAAVLHRQLEALLGDAPRRLVRDELWLYLLDADMPSYEHGWKLHVSTRAEGLAETMRLVAPVLLRHTCDAKFAVSSSVLRDLNSGERDPRLVGKAITIYPCAQDFVALAHELADVLTGRIGPRVLSDRRVRSGAPVHYRYGPFRAAGADGRTLVMTGPDGRTFTGRAGTRYRQPSWVADPFGRSAPAETSSAPLVGGRFRITAGVARSPRGDVFRGIDTVTGARVVVKQARAYMAEDAQGIDALGRLRHEHRVLAALDGAQGVPRLIDHVRHGEDEYLVMTDCGPADLRRDLSQRGPYAARGSDSAHQVGFLARQLMGILDAIHARAVVVADLKPHNVVLGSDGAVHVVDFGISALHGDRPAGGTRGYSLPVYRPDAEPDPADDLYALGATLHFALTGMDPVVVDPDRAVNRDRTLACLAAAAPGAALRPMRLLVEGLMSFDASERSATARRFMAGLPTAAATAGPTTPLPRPPRRGDRPHGRHECGRGAEPVRAARHTRSRRVAHALRGRGRCGPGAAAPPGPAGRCGGRRRTGPPDRLPSTTAAPQRVVVRRADRYRRVPRRGLTIRRHSGPSRAFGPSASRRER